MFETLTRIAQLSEMPLSGRPRNRASSLLGSLRRFKYHFSKASEGSRTFQGTAEVAGCAPGSSPQYKPHLERSATENRSRSPFLNRRSKIEGLRHADKRKSASLDALKEATSPVKSPPPPAKDYPPLACNSTKEAWTVSQTEVSDTWCIQFRILYAYICRVYLSLVNYSLTIKCYSTYAVLNAVFAMYICKSVLDLLVL